MSLHPSRTLRLVALSALLGVIGAVAARLFAGAIDLAEALFLHKLAGYVPPGVAEGGISPPSTEVSLWLPVATTLGGLLAGILVYSLAPEAEGHGTDAAVRAFHRLGGAVRARIPFVKGLASALTIGSGGAAGREGPTAQISAGVGSIIAQVFGLSIPDRRILVLAGISAGISAAFKSPLGAAIFSVEVLYAGMDFEVEALVFSVIAGSVAYAVNGFFAGWTPIFHVPHGLVFTHPSDLVWYGVLGVLAGVVAVAIPWTFYNTEAIFQRISIPRWAKPGLGGLLMGLLAYGLPQTLGGGYGWMQEAMNGALPIWLLLLLIPAKILGMSLTIGSGGSGGVFAPSLFVGCMLGAAVGHVGNEWLPLNTVGPDISAMAIVGMAAVFAAAGRVPLANLVMTAEITGGYGLIVPTMLAVSLAYLVEASIASRFKLKHPLLFRSQVATRADSPTHQAEFVHSALQMVTRGDLSLDRPVAWPDLARQLDLGHAIALGDGARVLYRMTIPEDSLAHLVPVRKLPFVSQALIAGIVREGRHIIGRGETVLRKGDKVLVICAPADLVRMAGWFDLDAPLVQDSERPEPPAAQGQRDHSEPVQDAPELPDPTLTT